MLTTEYQSVLYNDYVAILSHFFTTAEKLDRDSAHRAPASRPALLRWDRIPRTPAEVLVHESASSCSRPWSPCSSAVSCARNAQRGLVIGAAGGAVLGGVIGKVAGSTAKGAIIGAAVGGAAGAIIGDQMDRQAAELKQNVPGAKVERVGEGIQVTFASGLLYDFDSDVVKAEPPAEPARAGDEPGQVSRLRSAHPGPHRQRRHRRRTTRPCRCAGPTPRRST